MTICTIEGCGKAAIARGWCPMHYRRWKKHGDPLTLKQVQQHGLPVSLRLWTNVDRGPDCWEWTGYKDPNGYGRLNIGGVPCLTHRISMELELGRKLDKREHVLHKCDNPACVRPSHLFLGDQAANMADKMVKGRHVYGTSKGESHGCAKLTETDVRAIRESQETGVALAAQYGVSTAQVSDIRNRRSWQHID
jgi:hypothetical protein